MTRIERRYFRHLIEIVEGDLGKYSDLLTFLYETPFIILNERDINRVSDGLELRYDFGFSHGMTEEQVRIELDNRNCSILEVMVGLANRCNQELLYDEEVGNQAKDIFNYMIYSLGLKQQTNDKFNSKKVSHILDRFVNLDYEPDGKGGLFYIPNSAVDLKAKEIWYQMMVYLNLQN